MPQVPPRIVELIRREVGAARVSIVAPHLAPDAELDLPDAESATPRMKLRVAIGRGFSLLVELDDLTADREALERRLAILVDSFRESLDEALATHNRPQAQDLLHEELRALASLAGASDAVVIDAASDVTWGAANAVDAAPRVPVNMASVISIDPVIRRSTSSLPPPRTRSERAVDAVRALPAMAGLSRGGTLAHHERADVPYVARSLGLIYVLVLVFDGPFDELRAERALHGRLEVIERLILALPPLEPSPTGGARAMRKRG